MIDNNHSSDAQYSEPKAKSRRSSLDSAKNKKLQGKLLDWWTQAREIQSGNRIEQALDSDFKDGLQWKEEDAAELRERGQAPLVYNRIKPAVDWVLGTEKRGRMDFRVQARRDEQTKSAETKTALLKYLSDVNKTGWARSRAFDEAVTCGIGWLEDGVRSDATDEPVFSRSESWRNMWYDPLGIERDLSDARYLFRSKYIDLDVAKAMFPSRSRTLDAASTQANIYSDISNEDEFLVGFYNQRGFSDGILVNSGRSFTDGSYNRRNRVRLIECWYREPANIKVMRGETYDGYEYDENDFEQAAAIDEGYASVYDAVVMKMRVCIMTEEALLMSEESPYRHNEFPFTPVWGYRRNRDNAPYGMVRNIRDPQENLNKRMSKALHILSTNQIVAHEDAASDWDEIREEAARPDGIILLDGRKDAMFELRQDKDLAAQHVNLMELDAQMIQDVAGVTDENLGKQTNATSGRAVNARQEQGAVITAELFDNLRYAFQLQGEKQLSLVEQYYDQSKTIRIVGDNGEPEFMELNKPEINQETGEVEMMNDITSTKGDFIVDEQEYRATQRRAMFDMFSELFKSMDPEITVQLMDLMFEYSDLPGRDEIVSRIRKLNGQSDPSKKDDPEQQQQEQQQQEEEQQQKELEMRSQMLELEKMEADIGKTHADTKKTAAETIGTNVEALFQGIQVGAQIAVQPAAASIGDAVVSSAGFVDQNAAPIFPTDVPQQLVPMSRQERTLIQKQMGAESDRDGNPMTADNPILNKSAATSMSPAKDKNPNTSKKGGKKGIKTARAD
jgi:hypothetical protein